MYTSGDLSGVCYLTNFMACVQDLCASLQYELSQHTASHSQHVDELTLQLKNANQELSQRNASHSQHIDELHIQLENVNKELSLLQVSQCYQNHLPSVETCSYCAAQHHSALRVPSSVFCSMNTA